MTVQVGYRGNCGRAIRASDLTRTSQLWRCVTLGYLNFAGALR